MTSLALICRRAGAPAAALAALALGACGTTTSTSGFPGQQKPVAQALANLQSHANASEFDKLCEKDITKALREQLKGKSGCEKAFKRQLAQTDNLELVVQSVTIAPGGKTAKAQVKTTWEGEKRVSEVRLLSEQGAWRVAALGPTPQKK